MDIYNTVWLSDYESVKSFGSQSGVSSLNQSKLESFTDSVYHSSPRAIAIDFLHKRGWCKTCSRKLSPRYSIPRTLSLPELNLSALRPVDLQDRFSQLQLEQENNELRLLVDQLQNALETIEQSMNYNLKLGCNKQQKSHTSNGADNKLHGYVSPTSDKSSNNSLDNHYSLFCDNSHQDKKDRTESGYNSTFQTDVSGEFKERESNKNNRYSDYSDGSCSNSDVEFYESRLSKAQPFDVDDTSCCVIH